MSTLDQESGSVYTLSTLQPSATQTTDQQPTPASVTGDITMNSAETSRKGRPKATTTKKRRASSNAEDVETVAKRPKGRPSKASTDETAEVPKKSRGRPKKESKPVLPEPEPSKEASISVVPTAQEPQTAATSNQPPEYRRSSSSYRTIQNFSLGFDNALGRWDVEQLVLNMTRAATNGQLVVKGSIRLGFRAQELSREEHENLGQILKAPPLQNGDQLNISFKGEATSN